MARHRRLKVKNNKEKKKPSWFALPEETKRLIFGVFMFIFAAVVTLSFFNLAGSGGNIFMKSFTFLFGKAVFIFPLLLALGAISLFGFKYKNKWPIILAIMIFMLGLSGFLACFQSELRQGGWVGYLISQPFLRLFGNIATPIIFGSLVILGAVIFWQFLYRPSRASAFALRASADKLAGKSDGKPSLIKKIFGPKFKVKAIEPLISSGERILPPEPKEKSPLLEFKTKPLEAFIGEDYRLPPSDLLEQDHGSPTAGDIKINSAIIKRTLQNFDIEVEMSEVNIGPTVTQYTLKPAEGVKLAKITSLNNDLSLALAAHPLRIEAPIPGRPLVGIEVPNRVRTHVRMRNLIENPAFQNSPSNLTLVLGRDVAGLPMFADLGRMPHLLVAGSTGTGKTICLNSIITSLLYQNSPEILRFILIDPKRVEFPVYNDLPHLLTPVIFDAQKTVNAFKWLVGEMERRFEVLSENKARDIGIYNENMLRVDEKPMPYIVLIVDELADLMAARGREVEAGIVRLAQMARAVGIHLVVATQRPSVEVITGLIKANITSRITFQVASQVDSRTVLDMSGAEKLLGAGDMLFTSAETAKPKRAQGVFVSDKEVKKVVRFIKTENKSQALSELPEDTNSLDKTLEESKEFDFLSGQEDPLYEDAKKLVIEARKASASLLQRRLRVGYARAARLIDMLEEKRVVGPGEGAKPREILIDVVVPAEDASKDAADDTSDDSWQKV